MTSRPYRSSSLEANPTRNRALAVVALVHLALFQLFLFANTDYAIGESIRSFCQHAILRAVAAVPSSNPQPGVTHVSLSNHR